MEEALGKTAGVRQDGEIPSITWGILTGGGFFKGGLNPANIGSDLFCCMVMPNIKILKNHAKTAVLKLSDNIRFFPQTSVVSTLSIVGYNPLQR